MSHSLEHCPDATLNMRERSRRQHETELDMKGPFEAATQSLSGGGCGFALRFSL